MSGVMVLNASYEPLGGVSVRQAVRMLVREVAVVEESVGSKQFGPYPWPRVIRLVRYVVTRWLYAPAHFSRRSVLKRDRYVCAYCAGRATTVDHIVPRSRGGTYSFGNTVAACGPCNNAKADRVLTARAVAKLHVRPWTPRLVDLLELD